MPEAPEVKWMFMVVVIGALYMSKTKSKRHVDNSKGVVVYRQPSTLVGSHKAFAPIGGFSNQKSAEQIMRETKATMVDRTKEFNLMKSMNPEQQKAYLAKYNLTERVRGVDNRSIV